MFTGIIQNTGTIEQLGQGKLIIRPKQAWSGLVLGESIAVNGVCLTLTSEADAKLHFDLLEETLRVTSLGQLSEGASVNLERALEVGAQIGGHLLLGHVDGCGKLVERKDADSELTLHIEVPEALMLYMVPKGPVALDGISLTLAPEIQANRVAVHLIPHTQQETTLSSKQVGELVNIEVDMVAKYLYGVVQPDQEPA